MVLTTLNLTDYLLARRWLEASDVVDGNLVISDCTRRNRNFRLTREKGAGLFIKQARVDDPALAGQAIATISAEAALHELVRSDGAFGRLTSLLPEYCGFDAKNSALACRAIDAEDMGQYQRRTGDYSVTIAAVVGASLATFHRAVVPSRQFPQFPGKMPWMLTFHQTSAAHLATPSGGTLALHGAVCAEPAYGTAVAQLQQAWRVNSFTHGDMKWDNCLLPKPAQGEPQRVIFVDVELTDFGDGVWDAAGIMQGYLTSWVQSMPPQANSVESILSLAATPLTRVQPAIAAFWNAYVAELHLDAPTAAAALDRAVGYIAVRLVQSAYEMAQTVPRASATRTTIGTGGFEYLAASAGSPASTTGVAMTALALPTVAGLSMREQLREILTRTSIGSTGLLWDGQPFPSAAAMDPITALSQHLYAVAFTQAAFASSGGTGDLAPTLSQANGGIDRWDASWRISQILPSGAAQVRKGEWTRIIQGGEFLTHEGPGVPPRVGMTVSLWAPRESLGYQQGFYFAFGQTLLDSDADTTDLIRFYWNVRPTGAAALLNHCTHELNRFAIPFRMKCLCQLELFERLDAAVVYVHRRFARIAAELMIDIGERMSLYIGPGVPMFTEMLVPGLAYAQDSMTATDSPSVRPGESFGMHRCRLLAEAMVMSLQRTGATMTPRMEDVEQHFLAHGVSLDQPHCFVHWADPLEGMAVT